MRLDSGAKQQFELSHSIFTDLKKLTCQYPCGSCGEVVNLGKAALEFVHFREIPLHTSETPSRTGALTGELSLSVV